MREPKAIAILNETEKHPGELYVLADDGTIWIAPCRKLPLYADDWKLLPALPQLDV
jgi:hypothetical protein